ncbi:peptide chain release factor N(5)-glutamine methyltransferase [Actinotalea subterranea]|uniref:peptide chain release factor N(5)-glutamine methyltransferase n=1 Tax=Actinotalea subterranea TaxID=2607497 RepID=UPI0011ED0BC7|nr:peptide chain release factor N(5)-glutamine methyltransferase [Actinotalea subterranea]
MTPARPGTSLDVALREGAGRLAAAGVGSPHADVELLAGHLLGLGRGEVRAAAVLGRPAPDGLEELVRRRADRVPLQHLTGTAPFRGLELAVGPGVFVPRPETEAVAQVAVDAAHAAVAARGAAVVVDLCTGSGAIALAVAHEVAGARVHAVELDARAEAWARRNLDSLPAGARVTLVRGDARTALPELAGTVDVVVSNPPYIPPDAVPVDPEVRDHDPEVALYGLGPDGLLVPRGVAAAAARLLRVGGVLVMEHAEVQAPAVRRLVAEVVRDDGTPAFTDVATRTDLTGRDRMVVARRAAPSGSPVVKDSRP